VNRTIASFAIADVPQFKAQMLGWANQFGICAFLDNNSYPSQHHTAECLLAVDAVKVFSASTNELPVLKQFIQQHNDWLFGHVSYDFKTTQVTSSKQQDRIGFADISFFQPRIVVELKGKEVVIASLEKNTQEIFDAISQFKVEAIENSFEKVNIRPRISKEIYLQTIEKLRQHILRGDCYEINFCQEFFDDDAGIEPLSIYKKLAAVSPNPFSCFYKLKDKYVLCASPERYLKKQGGHIISQPIKGTIERNKEDARKDEEKKQTLFASSKDRSENVMVVDLVRNDLSKVCKENSVHVKELFGIYTFPQVHQMISTIEGTLNDTIDFVDVLEATFPMGSMTGAPKKRVMELIEQYEHSKRGIYSGCIGYITPEKDFDFNVVIRSILYNASTKYLSYEVGGGITFYSEAEKEYEECLLKAEAMRKVLQ
jgi:para-aminobenzoate synthetase component 1